MATDPADPDRRIRPAPDLLPAELAPLLAEPFAQAWAQAPQGDALRARLMQRAAGTRAAEAGMQTVRRRHAPRAMVAPGVQVQWLYRADTARKARPGEPRAARLFDIAPGATLPAAALGAAGASAHREWLVLQGRVQGAHGSHGSHGRIDLGPRDYHVLPAGAAAPDWCSEHGAQLFLRESDIAAQPGDAAHTVLDSAAGWPDFAPGIRRRVLWQRDGQAALLYLADPGAQVPMHTHGHDEECLMVQGELFLDDLLLQAGDYQLAPAGTGHRVTETDTGVVIYAHGDIDLQFV
jgi:quercetin dioxygenase-like cupin family protein